MLRIRRAPDAPGMQGLQPRPLSPQELVVIALHSNGATLDLIGEIMGMGAGAVRGTLAAAREALAVDAAVQRVFLAEIVERHVQAHPTIPAVRTPRHSTGDPP